MSSQPGTIIQDKHLHLQPFALSDRAAAISPGVVKVGQIISVSLFHKRELAATAIAETLKFRVE